MNNAQDFIQQAISKSQCRKVLDEAAGLSIPIFQVVSKN